MLLRFFHLLETDKKYHENMPFMEGNIVFIEVFKQYWQGRSVTSVTLQRGAIAPKC